VDFGRAADAIAEFLDREGVPMAVAGALALHAYGISRATSDLDIVTDSRARGSLVAFLDSLGYRTLHASAGYSNHEHPDPAMGRVDVIYVAGETSRKLFSGTGATIRPGRRELAVPRAEHLAAMKVHAMKNDPGRVFREMADIRSLLSLPGIDREEIRGYFEKAGLAERYDELRRSLDGA
jgi:hypothetical protein